MEQYEHQIAFQHALLEISKELLSATPERIAGIIKNALYELGELLLAHSVCIQLFNDMEDQNDDDLIYWSISEEAPSMIPISEDLIDFFMAEDPLVIKGTVEIAFGDLPFSYDTLIYPMFVHNQPIGFVRIALTATDNLVLLKKMVRQTVDIFTQAFDRRFRNRMIFEQASITEATLVAIRLGIVATDDGGHIEMVNQFGEELLGINQMTVIGKSIDTVIQIINETYDMQIESFIKEMIMTQDYMPIEDPISLEVLGQRIPISLQLSPKYDSNKLYQGAVLIFTKEK